MIEFMDCVLRAFEQSTSWNRDNSYENVNATSDTLLEFPIPTSFKFQTSDRSSNHTFNTLELTSHNKVTGSLTYLYTDAENLNNFIQGSRLRPLQEATETYRKIHPFYMNKDNPIDPHFKTFKTKSLYYGRMYYPTSIMEAMIIKRFNSHNQFTIKTISSVNSNLNMLLLNWQRYKNENFQEVLFSSDGALCGYRILHNVISTPSKFNNALYNNSSLSLGGEMWLGLSTLTPGCSTSLRYCTHAANTGRPLTLTFSWNPLFGHISSTYSAKTSLNTTFSAKYDFNLYSTDSNLSFGCELWRSNPKVVNKLENTINTNKSEPKEPKEQPPLIISANNNNSDISIPRYQRKLLDDVTYTFSSSLEQIDKEKAMIEDFENNFNNENFTNVWKLAASLRDRNFRILWEGKFKGFLISAGTELFFTRDYFNSVFTVNTEKEKPSKDANDISIPNSPINLGITIQYSS